MRDRRLPSSCRRRAALWRRGGPLVVGSLTLIAATPAYAYVGPGAGLSLLGALWGVAAAVVAALAFVVVWPLRRMIARRNGRGRVESSRTVGNQTPDRA